MRLILASTSPRRREILALLGLPFEVVAPPFEEIVSPARPIAEEVLDFAAGKAASVAAHHPESIVIGSDTMILLGDDKIGKPADAAAARRMLCAFAGKTHRIYTSVAIFDPNAPGLRCVEEVEVRMRDYSESEIEQYLALGESLDKAGAYSIQGRGRELIESIEGDYLAAVGLPLRPIARYLATRGIGAADHVEKVYAAKSYRNWSSF
ncbi:MAG TPA: Maf family protein [Candidatus Binatia bacterium]|jgi:septum formation protein